MLAKPQKQWDVEGSRNTDNEILSFASQLKKVRWQVRCSFCCGKNGLRLLLIEKTLARYSRTYRMLGFMEKSKLEAGISTTILFDCSYGFRH